MIRDIHLSFIQEPAGSKLNLICREEKRKGLKGFKGQIIEIQHNRIKNPNW